MWNLELNCFSLFGMGRFMLKFVITWTWKNPESAHWVLGVSEIIESQVVILWEVYIRAQSKNLLNWTLLSWHLYENTFNILISQTPEKELSDNPVKDMNSKRLIICFH